MGCAHCVLPSSFFMQKFGIAPLGVEDEAEVPDIGCIQGMGTGGVMGDVPLDFCVLSSMRAKFCLKPLLSVSHNET